LPPAEPKGNSIIITEQASGTARVDPLMAAFNAIAWMVANPAWAQPSVFVISRYTSLLTATQRPTH
jgi:phage terminase large subunit-like protein